MFRITGHVQGVFFRIKTKQRAEELGITGWVRNREDGSVKVFAQGEKEKLQKLEEWLWIGPSMARVEDVKKEETASEPLSAFEIKH